MIKLNIHFINSDTATIEFNEQQIKPEHRGKLTLDAVIAETCDKIKENGFLVVSNTIIPVNNIKLISIDMPEEKGIGVSVEEVAAAGSMKKTRNRRSKHD